MVSSFGVPKSRLREDLWTRSLHGKWSERARERDQWSKFGNKGAVHAATSTFPTKASQSASQNCTVDDKRGRTLNPTSTGQVCKLPLNCQVYLWECPVDPFRGPQHTSASEKSQSRNPRCAMQVKVDAGSEHVHEAVLSLRGTGYHSWGWRSGEANRMGCGAQRCLIQEAPGILLKWRHLKGPLTWESNSVCVDNGSRKRRERGEEVRRRGKRRGEEREVGKYTCDVLSPFHDLQ